ncbi:MAG: 16S rRNA (adenine(1518)-N(6)/adenine(1519)-N(6))-dimethyltransferase RsmA [Bacteroidales bacterium]|nr:16S rRNA (adenine(1518)-N(6)/adenine(1519)-N(6))-dimethyltransferase RsmA [Bacteroidales bacterium]
MKVTPKKRLGQHFLTDESVAEQIVASLKAGNRHVLEVGPGMGVLTKYLLQQPDLDFSVVELDSESVEYLKVHYPALAPRIMEADFLTLKLDELYQDNLTIIGNFPYNISTQIMFKMLEYKSLVTELVGMFQKEVAERIASAPGSKQYGILSVLVQAFYDVEYLFTVSEHQFFPPPQVKSAVIRVTKNPAKQLHCDENLFKQVVKAAFNQRRKTIRNSLKMYNFVDGFSTSPLFNLRPEQLSVAQFEDICAHIIK